MQGTLGENQGVPPLVYYVYAPCTPGPKLRAHPHSMCSSDQNYGTVFLEAPEWLLTDVPRRLPAWRTSNRPASQPRPRRHPRSRQPHGADSPAASQVSQRDFSLLEANSPGKVQLSSLPRSISPGCSDRGYGEKCRIARKIRAGNGNDGILSVSPPGVQTRPFWRRFFRTVRTVNTAALNPGLSADGTAGLTVWLRGWRGAGIGEASFGVRAARCDALLRTGHGVVE